MRKKILLVMVIFITVGLVIFYKQGELALEGNYYENLSDFNVESPNRKEDCSPLARAYMKTITYKIIELDKVNMKASVEVSVPQVTDALVQIVDKVLKNNPNTDSDKIKELVIQEFLYALEEDSLPKKTENLWVEIKRELFEYKLSPDETWYEFTVGQLEDLYLEYFRLMIGEITNETPVD